MKTTVEIGKTYALRSEAGGEVTDVDGKNLDTLEPNKQVHMTAQESEWLVPDDCKVTKTTFNYALAALGLLGGGDKLPAGYTRLEFLASTGTQYIKTGVKDGEGNLFQVKFRVYSANGDQKLFGCKYTGIATWDGYFRYYKMKINTNAIYLYEGNGVDYKSGSGMELPSSKAKVTNISTGEAVEDYFWVMNTQGTGSELVLCGMYSGASFLSNAKLHLFCAQLSNSSGKIRKFLPSLDSTGTPCMFDLVSKQPFKNAGTGQFIAGVSSVAQLTTLLRNLPDTGGELTLSLPAEANTPEVAEQLQACHDTKGWTLTVHEYRPAAAATYSLRRVRSVVWCRKAQTEMGSYVAADGSRWQVERCAAIFGAQGQDPAAYGYDPFDSEEHAAEQWGLVPYVEPETEENAD